MWLLGWCCSAEQCFGGHSGRETPGLIPNPEAKPASADGTALGRVWESRTPPNSNITGKGHPEHGVALTCIPTPKHPRVGVAVTAYGLVSTG